MLWIAAVAVSVAAQTMVTARAGLVSYAGDAYIDGQPVEISLAHLFVVKENAVLRTGDGRAEVLLGPCAAMWIDPHSSFRMISNAPSDTRIEVLTGSVVVADGATSKPGGVAVLLKAGVASLGPKGAYRLDAEPPEVRVLVGRAKVRWGNWDIAVNAGRRLTLGFGAEVRRCDKRSPAPLEVWGNSRAALLARLYAPQTADVQELAPPPTRDEMEEIKRGLGGAAPPSQHVPVQPIPASAPSRSGCAVTPW